MYIYIYVYVYIYHIKFLYCKEKDASIMSLHFNTHTRVLQCIAVYCMCDVCVLQRVAVFAVCCSVLKCVEGCGRA